MRMGQGVRTGLGHGGITCVLQTQFSSLFLFLAVIYNSWLKFTPALSSFIRYMIPISHFSFYPGTPITMNKNVMHSKTVTLHMQTFYDAYIILKIFSS